MTDITMCEGKECPLKEKCYRFKTKPNEYRQSYFIRIPYSFIKKRCDEFIAIIKNN